METATTFGWCPCPIRARWTSALSTWLRSTFKFRGARPATTGFCGGYESSAVFEYIFESNNVWQSDGVVSVALTPAADLAAGDLAAPSVGVVGHPVTVTWSVHNLGAGTSGDGTPGNVVAAWSDRVVLSPNAIYGDVDDRLLADADHGSAEEQGYEASWTGPLPASLSGYYHVFVFADLRDQVYENSDNGSNLTLGGSPIAVAPMEFADLAATDILVPGSASVGQQITVQWTVTNSPRPGSFHRRRVRSPQRPYHDDIVLGQIAHTGILAVGDTYTQSAYLTMPAGADGAYQVLVKADSGGTVYEFIYESNNVLGCPLELATPNLTAADVTAPPTALVGQQITVTWTGHNTGSAPAATEWVDGVYLSSDTVWSGDDVLLATVTATDVVPLAATASYPRSVGVTIPAGAGPAGTYHVIVRADSAGQVRDQRKRQRRDSRDRPFRTGPDCDARLTGPGRAGARSAARLHRYGPQHG